MWVLEVPVDSVEVAGPVERYRHRLLPNGLGAALAERNSGSRTMTGHTNLCRGCLMRRARFRSRMSSTLTKHLPASRWRAGTGA